MNPIDPASIPQRVVDRACDAYAGEDGANYALPDAMRRAIASALDILMDDEPVQVIDEFDGEPGEVLPSDVLAAVLKRQAA